MKKILPYLVLGLLILVVVKYVSASEVTGNLNPGLETGIAGVNKAAPVLSITAGDYHATQTVTLTASGASKICYTINGATPACASATTCSTGTALSSGGTISVNSPMTVKSVGCYGDGSQGPSGSTAYTFSCSVASISNGSVSSYPTCGLSCNSGYTLSNGSCVVQGGGGGGGGGGIVQTTSCGAVSFGEWQSACFGGIQFRNILTQTPANCILTTAQQNDQKRSCVVNTLNPEITPEETTVVEPVVKKEPVTSNVLEKISSESKIVSSNNTESLLNHLSATADLTLENSALTKYKPILSLDKKISSTDKSTINDFIVYGTQSTQRLGGGERAAVINSYYQAFGKLLDSENEWSDALKIASGRWPSERSAKAEAQAKLEFRKVYARNAVMTNNTDQNAIMVMAYGLLPLQRNLNSEKTAIKTFTWVYGHAPVNALAWNVVRSIAYSGATR